ncbi:hypothetical protein BVJ53_09825 [Lacticaseibacillus chiayiensis]|uniref:Uncharacterized protein n=1 Tax=Lacticaseibacillus chiayiensis TaxID=2100821 RepID=A0A4Q1TS79_9LACO|nr:hypothetical protein [Lacticaseibacillus chiayiensis]QVI34195.1 hypothetical protein KG086_10410 [Lacticaseibacillus chiayiensis]RXT20878.1 hypothetical protein BVJ53_09825 [Lacticaseibacillus chiayiensis]UYN55975.1 hypothetical protein OFW50_10890 [Lacticaseibacillus chiayiensis]
MGLKRIVIKILISGAAILTVMSLQGGGMKAKPVSVKTQQAAMPQQSQKSIPLFQQMAVFPDGCQQPLAGGVFAFYRFDIKGRKQYRMKSGKWQLVGNPLTAKGVYLAQADQVGVVGITGTLGDGNFYVERLRLPARYAVKLPLPVKVGVSQGDVTVNGQLVRGHDSLPRVYAMRVAATQQ